MAVITWKHFCWLLIVVNLLLKFHKEVLCWEILLASTILSLRHVLGTPEEEARRKCGTSLMLVTAQLGSALFSLSATSTVWGLCCVICKAFLKGSRGLQTLIHYCGLNTVKCGCCWQQGFIWQWLICPWTCWQDSIGKSFCIALNCVNSYYCASCTFLRWAKFEFNIHKHFFQAVWPQQQMCSSDMSMNNSSMHYLLIFWVLWLFTTLCYRGSGNSRRDVTLINLYYWVCYTEVQTFIIIVNVSRL